MSETDMDWPLRQVGMSLQMDGTYSYGLGRLGRPGMSKPFVRLRPEVAEAINEQVAQGLAAEHRLAYAEGRTDEQERNTPLDIAAYRLALLSGLRVEVQALIETTEKEAAKGSEDGNYTYATILRVRAQGMQDVLALLNGSK